MNLAVGGALRASSPGAHEEAEAQSTPTSSSQALTREPSMASLLSTHHWEGITGWDFLQGPQNTHSKAQNEARIGLLTP